jgi:hypothetical protein
LLRPYIIYKLQPVLQVRILLYIKFFTNFFQKEMFAKNDSWQLFMNGKADLYVLYLTVFTILFYAKKFTYTSMPRIWIMIRSQASGSDRIRIRNTDCNTRIQRASNCFRNFINIHRNYFNMCSWITVLWVCLHYLLKVYYLY